MKLIQILAIAAALAVSAAAQNTNSANSTAQPKTSDAQKKDTQKKDNKTTPGTPIKVTTPKDTKTGATAQKSAAGGNSQSKSGTQKSQPIVVNAQPKSGTAASATKTGAASVKSAPAGKTPVVAVAPQSKQKTSASKGGPFAAKPATAQKKPAVVAVTPKTAPKKPAVAKKQEPKITQKTARATPVPAKPAARKISATGRRDPFVSPIRNVIVGQTGPSCSTGKKCLYIPELIVQGTVKDNTTGEMMAVVVNHSRHTYFLRENDQVFNGLVEKITGDSVVFREFATDSIGRESAHEVVKRVSSAS
ncbi:MAG: hypothetical protein DMG65_10890 [Candidatus Angelobacter sp. Gp1-AA117]|nr:MAG: hypothetical protein DMG65_10890 [Candidatus Angelobacter sp. Gp1-AA117]